MSGEGSTETGFPPAAFRTGGLHWLAMLVASAVGLALALVHPVGYLVGGALVGLLAYDRSRALLAGLAFGVFAWLAFALLLFANGSLPQYLATGQALLVSVAIPVVGSLLGSLVRWLF